MQRVELLDSVDFKVFVPVADAGLVVVGGPALQLLHRVMHLHF